MQIKQKRTLKGGSNCTYHPGNHRENMDNCNFSQSQNICTNNNRCTNITSALMGHMWGAPGGDRNLDRNLMTICRDPSTSVNNLGSANAIALHNYDARCAKIQTGSGKKRRTKKTSKSKAKRRTKRTSKKTSKSKAKRRTKRTSKSGAKRRTKRTTKSKAKRRTKRTTKKRKSRK